MKLASRIAEWIHREHPDAVFVDDGGVGGGVVDRLYQLGFHIVQGVNFGARSDRGTTGKKVADKLTEMWCSARDWIARGYLPVDDRPAEELTSPMFGYDARSALMLERKDSMRRRGVPSPDIADAFALTFAYPVWPRDMEYTQEKDGFAGRSKTTGY